MNELVHNSIVSGSIPGLHAMDVFSIPHQRFLLDQSGEISTSTTAQYFYTVSDPVAPTHHNGYIHEASASATHSVSSSQSTANSPAVMSHGTTPLVTYSTVVNPTLTPQTTVLLIPTHPATTEAATHPATVRDCSVSDSVSCGFTFSIVCSTSGKTFANLCMLAKAACHDPSLRQMPCSG
ncbi:uncharacterized protein LOC127860169 isoform X3 [Dreissena polymorpha]|uniref:uncharacterized protein LOC127860169 isoform X3 n=1 Tax=Dreissena polymorpha TaxID=45954 RepID=UPI0022644C21|nr:uncharacterized protein LOC127860169 isoform X3 [Dreissena polymorpha]